MKVLITGGAGFIGSAVIRMIADVGRFEIVNIDALTYAGNLSSLSDVGSASGYWFEKIDICDRRNLNNICEQYEPDAVMHLAAESHVDRSIDGPAEFIQTPVQ